jgi:filamentous hemagglutinin
LDSTYQLRLQTYRSVAEKRPLTIYTSRPVDTDFGQWLHPHGVAIKPLPPEPEP